MAPRSAEGKFGPPAASGGPAAASGGCVNVGVRRYQKPPNESQDPCPVEIAGVARVEVAELTIWFGYNETVHRLFIPR